ncbi:hypothetical protein [Nonomuraea endophytica]|uniref:hypothetical protein n=1 Tax=Nonomuraea endophytica TaxID=714136 RepID=UPI0037C909C4
MDLYLMIPIALIGGATGTFVMIVLSVLREDWRGSPTHRAPGPFSRCTRGILGLHVNNTDCTQCAAHEGRQTVTPA